LRHYLATLVGLSTFAHPPTLLRYAVWLCDDDTDNCPVCRQREGIAIPATTRRLSIIDPYCDCNLHVMTPGQEDTFLASVVRIWLSQDSERAQTLQRNAYRAGFLRKPLAQTGTGGCCGCGMALMMLLTGVLLTAIIVACSRLL
jgi:hypothetical protein